MNIYSLLVYKAIGWANFYKFVEQRKTMEKTCDNCIKVKVCKKKGTVCKDWSPFDIDKYLEAVECGK